MNGVNGMKCAVTGANGYLGKQVTAFLRERGADVVVLSRSSAPSFHLGADLPSGFFRDRRIQALVHCAYDFGLTSWEEIHQVNVEGTRKLLQAAKTGDVEKIITISTMSAFPGCQSLYGQAKLEIEEITKQVGGWNVRPGLIFGKGAQGMVGSLLKATRRPFPVVPLIGNGKQILYASHQQDLCALIVSLLADGSRAPQVFVAACPEPFLFRNILMMARKAQHPQLPPPLWLPVPWRIVWFLLKVFEGMGLRPSFRSDSVVSLVHQDPAPDFSFIRKWNVPFRSLHEREL